MMTKADILVMQLQAKECQGLPAKHQTPGRGEGGFSLHVSDGPQPC